MISKQISDLSERERGLTLDLTIRSLPAARRCFMPDVMRRVPSKLAVSAQTPPVSVQLRTTRTLQLKSSRHLSWAIGGFVFGVAMAGMAVSSLTVWPLLHAQIAADAAVTANASGAPAATKTRSGKAYTARLGSRAFSEHATLSRCSELVRGTGGRPTRAAGCARATVAIAATQ